MLNRQGAYPHFLLLIRVHLEAQITLAMRNSPVRGAAAQFELQLGELIAQQGYFPKAPYSILLSAHRPNSKFNGAHYFISHLEQFEASFNNFLYGCCGFSWSIEF